jgi:hypothetical protein
MEDCFTLFEKIGGTYFSGKTSEVVEAVWKELTLEEKVKCLEAAIGNVVGATEGPHSFEFKFRG